MNGNKPLTPEDIQYLKDGQLLKILCPFDERKGLKGEIVMFKNSDISPTYYKTTKQVGFRRLNGLNSLTIVWKCHRFCKY